jgi:hypothetical protein
MHAAVESDVYEGYYIPKGIQILPDLIQLMLICSADATVTPNVWYGR